MRLSEIWRACKLIREGGRLADERGLRGAERSEFVQVYARCKWEAWEREQAERVAHAFHSGEKAAMRNLDTEGEA